MRDISHDPGKHCNNNYCALGLLCRRSQIFYVRLSARPSVRASVTLRFDHFLDPDIVVGSDVPPDSPEVRFFKTKWNQMLGSENFLKSTPLD